MPILGPVTTWHAVRFVHELAMAFFVGGQLFLAAAVMPVHRGGEGGHMAAIARNFGYGTLVAAGALLISGVALASHFAQWGNPKLHVKLALIGVLAGLVAWHLRAPGRRSLDGAIFLVSLAIVWLGVGLAH